MPEPFTNIYSNPAYASAYSRLEFSGTYALAFRDLPAAFERHVCPGGEGRPRRALDFCCGAGRSTRFLERCGFAAVGVDVSADMVKQAREADPAGDYRVIADGDFSSLPAASFDLVFAAFPFDNVPTRERKAALLSGLRALLAPEGAGRRGAGGGAREAGNGPAGGGHAGGRLVNLVSSPEIYVHAWASFSTRAVPENRQAKSGDVVQIVNLAIADRTPCEDVLWTEEAWQETYAAAGLAVVEVMKPLAGPADTGEWVSETDIAPWTVYVLRGGDEVMK